MARLNPYAIKVEINRLFQQGQSFFAIPKVESWLREHQQDPNQYEIQFVEEMADPDEVAVMHIRIHLSRRDGQPVDPWLIEEINRDQT
ncbi:MAG: hypothetical protein HC921_01785 [Synechococcaceae cyanobacterium SM2_3_1]|nr:hypothetical protein [Synechococcaceae cyanobacterium SM2_3_1]